MVRTQVQVIKAFKFSDILCVNSEENPPILGLHKQNGLPSNCKMYNENIIFLQGFITGVLYDMHADPPVPLFDFE